MNLRDKAWEHAGPRLRCVRCILYCFGVHCASAKSAAPCCCVPAATTSDMLLAVATHLTAFVWPERLVNEVPVLASHATTLQSAEPESINESLCEAGHTNATLSAASLRRKQGARPWLHQGWQVHTLAQVKSYMMF